MDADPPIPPYKTSDPTSFAYISAKDRWPVILTGVIDDVFRSSADSNADDPNKLNEGKAIVEELGKLKYELGHNRPLTPLLDDGKPDISIYNHELEQLGHPTWFNVSWLYSECYLYRRIATHFELSNTWKSYDWFSRQKRSTFKSSRPAVLELASRYKDLTSQIREKAAEDKNGEEIAKAQEVLFIEMCEICLWGNATDLSLLTNLSYDDIQRLQGSKARKAAEANIVANDLAKAFAALKTARKQKPNGECRVDIVLDNAGFELYVDLILAGYLIASGLADTVVLHPKSIPWFVSDVIISDFTRLLSALIDPQKFFITSLSHNEDPEHNAPLSRQEVENLKFLFDDWATLHSEGQFILRPNRFWTHPGSYWRLPQAAPDLYADLQQSQLVIFKGDLNYRKLTGDVEWPTTTPFKESIGPLAGGSSPGLRVLALRTCKADVVVGLAEGEDERLKATEGGSDEAGARKWAWSGKWAVAQFCDGKVKP